MDILLTCPASWPSGLSPPPGEVGGSAAAGQGLLWATASQQQVQGQESAFAGLIEQLLRLAGQDQGPLGGPFVDAHGWINALRRASELPPASAGPKGEQGPQDTLGTEESLLAWAWQGVLLHLANGWSLDSLIARGQGSGQSHEGHIQAVGQVGQSAPTDVASTPAQVGSASSPQPPALVGAGLGLNVAGLSRPKAQASEPTDGLALQSAAGTTLAGGAEGTDLVRLSSSAPTDGHPPGATAEPSEALGLSQMRSRGNPEIQSQAQSAKLAKGGETPNHVRVVAPEPSLADADPANTDDRAGLMGLQQATREVIGESGELLAAEPGSGATAAGEAAQEGAQPKGMTREPEGITPQPKGMTREPEGITPQPKGMTPEPERITSQPKGMTREPEGITPQSKGMTPQPRGMTPEPERITSQPKGMAPEPEGITPQPKGMTPEPEGTTPQPKGMTRGLEGYAPMSPMETPVAAMPATEGQSTSGGSPGNGASALAADSHRGAWAQQQEPAQSRPADGYPPIGSGSPAGFGAGAVGVAEADEAAGPGERFAIELVSRLAGDLGRLAILGRHRAVLQLYPPELGQMNVRLSLGGEGLTVHMVVQNAEVRAIVESSLSQLQVALADQGLQAAALYVQVGQEADQRPRAWVPQKQPAGRHRPDPGSPQVEAVATPGAITALRSQDSTLEYWI